MEKYTSKLLNETIYQKKLECGLEVYFIRKYGFKQFLASYSTKYGSIDNKFIVPNTHGITKVLDGIAHFLEHKMFEGKEQPVFTRFSKIGSSCNAFTSFNLTNYMFMATSRFYDNMEILLDFVNGLHLTDESVEKEKGIIEQEIKMYEDDPTSRKLYGLLESLYKNHPIRINIAGDVPSIKKITKEDLYKCYNTFYHPSNMNLIALADIDPEKYFDFIEKWFNNKGFKANSEIERVFPIEPESVLIEYNEEFKSIPRPIYSCGFKWKPFEGSKEDKTRQYAIASLASAVTFGQLSPIYKDLFNSSLIDNKFEFGFESGDNYNFFICTGSTDDPDQLNEKVKKYIRGVKRRKLKKEDFELAKKKFIGESIGVYDNLFNYSFSVQSDILTGRIPLKTFDIISDIKIDEVIEARKKLFDENKRATFVLKPKK